MNVDRFSQAFFSTLCALAVLAAAGCGGMKLYSVSGIATLDGKPLTGCAISFSPDTAKGNTHVISCIARPDADGRFNIRTTAVRGSEGGMGMPLGWYKVSLVTGLPGDPEIRVKPAFLDANKSPLSIEVVANPEPGRYDLKFTK